MKKAEAYFPIHAPGDVPLKTNLMRAGLTQDHFTTVNGYENEFVDLDKTRLRAESEFNAEESKLKYSLFYKDILIAETTFDKNERKMVLHERRFWSSAQKPVQESPEINEAVIESLNFSGGYLTRALSIEKPSLTSEPDWFKPGCLIGKRF